MRQKNFKKKLLLLSILTGAFAIFIAIKYLLLDHQNDYGQLQIISSPQTNIFIDNVNVGRTPYDQPYKVGDYSIKLIPDREATSTATWQGKISVYKKARTYVNRELKDSDITSAGEIFTLTKMDTPSKEAGSGEVYVETEPVGALIYLDTDEKGVAPSRLDDVPAGVHELSVYLPGFFRRTTKINVEADRKLNALFKLAIDREAQKKQASDSAQIASQPTSSDSARISPTTTPRPAGIIVKILSTPTGWLRVRYEPDVNASEAARVNPGETYSVVDERPNWYKIPYSEGHEGWISSQYAQKQ